MFYKFRSFRNCFAALMVGLLLAGCTASPVYQRQEPIPHTRWESAFKPVFYFDVSDTQATYNLYFLIRHTEAYPFSNIWLRFSIKGPHDSVAKAQQLEIPLAQDNGRWYGRQMSEVWEQRMPVATEKGPNILFPEAGRYTIQLEHLMRTNPLPEVMNVGIRVEKRGVAQKSASKTAGPSN